jgi:hypothetical protein
MTPRLTGLGRNPEEIGRTAKEPGDKNLLYTLDHAQLLGLWSVIRLFGEIREAEDPSVRSEIAAEAQRRMAAFVSELKPLSSDQIRSTASLPGQRDQ